jgi:hypothetical protein
MCHTVALCLDSDNTYKKRRDAVNSVAGANCVILTQSALTTKASSTEVVTFATESRHEI